MSGNYTVITMPRHIGCSNFMKNSGAIILKKPNESKELLGKNKPIDPLTICLLDEGFMPSARMKGEE